MGVLVSEAAERSPDLIGTKRAGGGPRLEGPDRRQ